MILRGPTFSKDTIMTKHSTAHPGESGNVMIYIFLAIAMFAALSFAVANIMKSGTGDPNREVMQLQSTDLIQYADALKRGVQSMKIRSLEDNQISFEVNTLTGYTPHPSCSDDSCRLFRPNGGGISYVPPPEDWLDQAHIAQPLSGQWYFPTGVCVQDVGMGSTGCESDTEDNEELIAVLPYIRRDLCIQINDRLGIANPGGEPPQAIGPAWPVGNPKFRGTYTEEAIIARSGQMAGCLRGSGTPPSNSYFFYRVLLSR